MEVETCGLIKSLRVCAILKADDSWDCGWRMRQCVMLNGNSVAGLDSQGYISMGGVLCVYDVHHLLF